jgi:hypothetical protein
VSRGLKTLNVVAIALVFSYGLVEYALPLASAVYWKQEYADRMFKCDQAMREHYIAKQAVSLRPSASSVTNLEAAEVGLLDCHEYDKLRKRLLALGVSEPILSAIGLETIESKAYELREFVEIHEFRY